MEKAPTNTIYDELSARIVGSDKIKIYHRLVKNEIFANIQLEESNIEPLSDSDIQFLLESASILACSSSESHKQLAYSIVIILYTQFRQTLPEIYTLTSMLLVRLGNFPAYQLVNNKIENEVQAIMPLPLQLEAAAKSMENRVNIVGKELYFTDFQRLLFDSLINNTDFSFSAPTSAGKSFLLILYIYEQFKRSSKLNIVYVVPTKALINQVKNDLKKELVDYGLTDVKIISSTVSFEFEDMYEDDKHDKHDKHVLILTQERLSYLLSKKELKIPINILIIDEAQKINDGNRGVLLERVILQTIALHSSCKVIFSSPLASNPEFFQKFKQSVLHIKSDSSPVHQNVLYVNSKKKPFISLLGNDITVVVESSALQKKCPKTDKAKMAYYAYHLGKDQSNILYGNGPADTEELAWRLCEYLPDVSHPKIDRLIDFIINYVHQDYSLIYTLKKGVVFHYSTMPRELKEEIEKLFKEESVPVSFMCCTSTLLEGMNLPARNVFIQKPTKGQRNKMQPFDFWNLAGRAGRLLKDFYGNIYCIDVDSWGEDSYVPVSTQENYHIKSATEEVIEKPVNLVEYLQNIKVTLAPKERDLLEQTTSTLFLNHLENPNETLQSFTEKRSLKITDKSELGKIDQLIAEIAQKSQLPMSIIEKNSSVDPRRQNNLFNYFRSMIYTTLLPKFPGSSEFYPSLESIFRTIDHVFFDEADKKIIGKYVYLANEWITEVSIAKMISDEISYEKKTKKGISDVNRCVRNVIDIIDRTLTYKYAKYLKCYNDILEYYLSTVNTDVKLINLSGFLELGANKLTTLSLISFGLSR